MYSVFGRVFIESFRHSYHRNHKFADIYCCDYSISSVLLFCSGELIFDDDFCPNLLTTKLQSLLFQKFYISTARQLKRLMSASNSPVLSLISETVQGLSSVRVYKLESWFLNELFDRIDNNQKCWYPTIVANRFEEDFHYIN